VPRVDYEKLSGDRLGESNEFVGARLASHPFETPYRAVRTSLKLARTIADLVGSEEIRSAYLAEALQYRPKLMTGQHT